MAAMPVLVVSAAMVPLVRTVLCPAMMALWAALAVLAAMAAMAA